MPWVVAFSLVVSLGALFISAKGYQLSREANQRAKAREHNEVRPEISGQMTARTATKCRIELTLIDGIVNGYVSATVYLPRCTFSGSPDTGHHDLRERGKPWPLAHVWKLDEITVGDKTRVELDIECTEGDATWKRTVVVDLEPPIAELSVAFA